MKQWINLVIVTLFGLGLVLPTIDSLCHLQKEKTIYEDRPLARLPEWRDGLGIWQEYRRQMEAFYGDHFGFRESLIAFDLMIKRALFAEMGPNVLSGREGWLYLKRDCNIDAINDSLGVTKFSRRQLNDLQMRLENRRDWLAAQGIKYLCVIVPNKETIYPEYLPAWLKPPATTKTDQFVDYMRLHSTVEVLDLRPVLRQARQNAAVYFKTDSHWNLMGSFIASATIISNLSCQIPGLVPLGLEEFEIKRQPGTGGDLARMAGEPDAADDNRYVLKPGPNLPTLEFSSSETNDIGWPQIWSIPVADTQTVITINKKRTRRVVIFGDSFAVKLQPFLGFHFGKVVLLRTYFSQSEVKQVQPALVIDEFVERLLQ